MSADNKLKSPVRKKEIPLTARRTGSQGNKNKTMTSTALEFGPFNIKANKCNLKNTSAAMEKSLAYSSVPKHKVHNSKSSIKRFNDVQCTLFRKQGKAQFILEKFPRKIHAMLIASECGL